ncbi:hypothetical protein HNR46_003886, partial [Haloferula luteola]
GMRSKVDNSGGRERYSHRMGIIEPALANIRHVKAMNRFDDRGRRKVSAQCRLEGIVHNLVKIALSRPGYATGEPATG